MKMTIATLLLVIAGLAHAGEKEYPPPPPPSPPANEIDVSQSQTGISKSGAKSYSESSAQSASEAASDAQSSSSNSLNQTYEAGAPDIVLIPQGHTSNCQRTYGLSFADKNGGGGVGWPYRDKNCDYDNEAADAFAAGQYKQGWFWNCQKKSSYSAFRSKGMKKAEAIDACVAKMAELYVEPKPVIVNCDHPEEHDRVFTACQSK